ncbi:T-cell activation inhibitor, mitochondrial-like [Hydractinia symbiolongicarpus]|uniref:T-cell activation inhibitor, mitochondrial-like n=1 Tax=Hydractinia symbiolongicarpus TaxID=13093 RepID=UPI00254D1EE0|nr:T-cell activation inhibitor, mitochondrial-like [Hydractinia symbiolongicarpus]
MLFQRSRVLSSLLRGCQQLRCYSSSKRSLKKFYLTVHPDVFPHDSNEKKVNEESLKIFHSYLNSLERNISVPDTTLTFYQASNKGDYSKVKLLLRGKSREDVIQDVLTVFNLPTDIKVANQKYNVQEQEIIQNKYFGSLMFGNFKKDTQQTLESWLSKNNRVAQNNQIASEAIRIVNIKRLQKLNKMYGVTNMLVDTTTYSYALVRSVLKQLEDVLGRYFESFTGLKGRVMVFGDFSGLDQWGRFVLNVFDVPESWKEALSSITRTTHLLQSIERVEKQLSDCCFGVKFSRIKSVSPSYPIKAYWSGLNSLLRNINTKSSTEMERVFDSVMVIPEWYDEFISISEEGFVKLPHQTSRNMLYIFLENNAENIQVKRRNYLRNLGKKNKALQTCKGELKLKYLSDDTAINTKQVLQACDKLCGLKDNVAFKGLVLILSSYYSVSVDGFIRIPWDFIP